MEVKDIVVGKRYRNISDIKHEQIMLGVGMRKLYTENEFTEKHLVIIESPIKENIGKMIQEGENAQDGLWDRFEEEDSGLYVKFLG